MKTQFKIDYRHSVGNLHIKLSGAFNEMCAWELLKTIKIHNAGIGRIFVNTAHLSNIDTAGVDLFKLHMGRKKIPQDWLYFKGQKGFQIAPDRGRVLICNKQQDQGSSYQETLPMA